MPPQLPPFQWPPFQLPPWNEPVPLRTKPPRAGAKFPWCVPAMATDVASITTIKQTRNDLVFIGLEEGHKIRHRKVIKVVTF